MVGNAKKRRCFSIRIRGRKLTILGRSLLLFGLELVANAVCWIVAGILFGRHEETRSLLSLALLAWTIGLRHGLDADHISAIDNATRGLIQLGQLPVTCGLYFSLGHSTIVIAVNVAIAISTDVFDHIDGVGSVGAIVGSAVSGSFLFIIGLANSIILAKILRKRRQRKHRIAELERQGLPYDYEEEQDEGHNTIMMKILGPVTRFVNRPWKMYIVGVLFGFGFDTASSIALLAVSVIAKRGADGKGVPASYVVILPLLFTAGMSLVDSTDSILMLYSYAGFPEPGWNLLEKPSEDPTSLPQASANSQDTTAALVVPAHTITDAPMTNEASDASSVEDKNERRRSINVKRHTMSDLSVFLTLVSILVAFSVSLIVIMGLIGDNCGPCQEAANDPNGGGLAGRWWRGWAKANDDSGFIGAAIVGGFATIFFGWFGARWISRKWKGRRSESAP
ncbi:NicO-domain-containing protein [Sistotremastrum suecicum HHB10207 ss-3]|uniref:Nickel/cobalt efflux system n=1 Tax=Sistotremastrum suecicum HHB10207 ss-3 TaxID=1314776 RepID=A0A165ZSE5_9AGAM|nr:NicO-domain-containing protein [Sistotremastrum suecicum HHB10207 ss-3]